MPRHPCRRACRREGAPLVRRVQARAKRAASNGSAESAASRPRGGDGSVAVVDYKFGVRNHRGYYEQVRDYMSLLEQAGQTDVHGYLWFPLTHTIIEVQ